MSSEFQLILNNASGVRQAVLAATAQGGVSSGGVLDVRYSKQVNAPGYAELRLNGSHPLLSSIELNWQLEIYRRNVAMGLDWTCDYYGLMRYWRYEYGARDLAVLRFPGQLTLLADRNVAWAASTANRTKFTAAKAETIMKTLVDYNAGANATVANGRLREGAITGVSIAADGAAGNTLDWACTEDNLLETLKKLADVGGGDFGLVKTGALTWEFRWYTGQLGTDRSTTVKFSLELGNMASPQLIVDRTDEKTAGIVGGQGDGSTRAVVIRTGVDYNASSNNRETFIDARDLTTTAGLQSRGDTKLWELRQKKELTFKVLQTPSCFYGVHYTLGDLVTATYKGFSGTFKLNRVDVNMEEKGGETVDVGLTFIE